MGNWGKAFVYSGVIIGGAYAMMKLTVPTPEQLYERLPEEMKQEVIKNKTEREKKHQLLMETIQKNVNSDRPVWDVQGFEPATKDKDSA
ncbi:hypothetical protein K493DRAFT_320780 [Basidiobolus meristosporus CBS 931.73]|uniref:Cytochrome b mRNA-processing protein 4 n=1 Tax=Basidiobolus meristosporus CBS 931.73 TaxID=1314790 RepID=A0A1Y1X595_9FUNG|nr:hypothetical protein K493DRAFT_320780 [Basidiobolus meristosporus CBS 931.73]|eukprot:ORX80991.1 hypothetical protein K493DRAFT_320780 [Basidiobolus meristosporus CBS 931.73]